MVPRVEDAATAARLAGFASYGPEGRRGEGLGVARASRWGRQPGAYRDRWRATGGLVLQIESPAGLAAAAAIAATPGVTELFFGPADFAAALGVGREDPQVVAAARATAAAARAAGREAGVFAQERVSLRSPPWASPMPPRSPTSASSSAASRITWPRPAPA